MGDISSLVEKAQAQFDEAEAKKLGLKEISEEDYRSTFWALFEKRKAAVQGLSSTLQKKKIMSYMLYRGWETHLIYEALNDL